MGTRLDNFTWTMLPCGYDHLCSRWFSIPESSKPQDTYSTVKLKMFREKSLVFVVLVKW